MRAKKRPITVDVWEIDGTEDYPIWMKNRVAYESIKRGPGRLLDPEPPIKILRIRTLEGTMKAQIGDYVIHGAHGEIYPCNKDVFHSTYDLVDDENK